MFDRISDLNDQLFEHSQWIFIQRPRCWMLHSYWGMMWHLLALVVVRLENRIVVWDNKKGMDPKCEVFISNPSLSGSHAVVEANRDGCTVHDVHSSNVTKKGGVRLTPNVR